MKPVFLHWQDGRREESDPDVSIGEMQVPELHPPHSESSRTLWMSLAGGVRGESIVTSVDTRERRRTLEKERLAPCQMIREVLCGLSR
jgi:hypothetical protein